MPQCLRCGATTKVVTTTCPNCPPGTPPTLPQSTTNTRTVLIGVGLVVCLVVMGAINDGIKERREAHIAAAAAEARAQRRQALEAERLAAEREAARKKEIELKARAATEVPELLAKRGGNNQVRLDQLTELLPFVQDVKAKGKAEKEVERLKAIIVKERERAAAAEAAERARQAKIDEERGPKPESSSWDSAVREVVSFLKYNANDPKSLEFDEWSPVIAGEYQGKHCWVVRCRYRGRNGFGGMVVENQVFYIRNSSVVGYEDF